MVNYLLGVLGIGVSVALFLIGYRQTVGARKERTSTANSDLERILSRRVILEKFLPTRQDIDRLRDGKSHEYRVALSDMLPAATLMNIVYTRLVENDFISLDLRKQIFEGINPILERLSIYEEQEVEPAEESFARSALPLLLALFTSLLGAAVAVLPQLRSIAFGKKQTIEIIAVTAGVSLVIITAYLLFNRLRDEQEQSLPRGSLLRDARDFEKSVASAIKKSGSAFVKPRVQSGYDFEVTTKNGTKVLVEARMWPWRVPNAMVRQVADRLGNLVAEQGAKEALLVVRSPVQPRAELVGDAPVKIISLRELQDYLAR